MRSMAQSAKQPSRWIACLAIFMVLLAGSVQVCHVCGLDGVGSSTHTVNKVGSLSDTGGLCPICLSSQTASAPVALLTLAPKYAPVAAAILPAIFLQDSEPQFALSIRPPPLH